MGNILLVLFLFGLHRADLVYSEFGLHIIPVYSVVYTGFLFIQDLVYTGFMFIQGLV